MKILKIYCADIDNFGYDSEEIIAIPDNINAAEVERKIKWLTDKMIEYADITEDIDKEILTANHWNDNLYGCTFREAVLITNGIDHYGFTAYNVIHILKDIFPEYAGIQILRINSTVRITW